MDYGPLAANYAQHRRPHALVLKALEQHIGAAGARRVLEVGCGTGAYIDTLALECEARCVGLDPAAGMLARASGTAMVERVQARAEAIPLSAASVDLVFTVDVVHHVVDLASYFGDAHRVLTAGGWVCTATDSEAIIRSRQPLSAYFPETVAADVGRYPTLGRLRELMVRAGFEDLREHEVGLSYALTDIGPYRDRAYSALHLIDDAAFARGLARLAEDLNRGPVPATSRYAMLWGRRNCLR